MFYRACILYLFLIFCFINAFPIPIPIPHKWAQEDFLTCLNDNTVAQAALTQQISDCLNKPVNALYLEVYQDPRSDAYSSWAFSFRSFYVVLDVTARQIDLLSFTSLSLNLCILPVQFTKYCNASQLGLSSRDERNLIGTYLFSQYIVNQYKSVQLGIISGSKSDQNTSKIMTVEQSAYLCELKLFPTPSYCCLNNLTDTISSNSTVNYPVACPIQQESHKQPVTYLYAAFSVCLLVIILVLFSNISYLIPEFYSFTDHIINADISVPIFWVNPGQKWDDNQRSSPKYFAKFTMISFPIIWVCVCLVFNQVAYIIVAAILGFISMIWGRFLCLDDRIQTFLRNHPTQQPLYALTLLKKRYYLYMNDNHSMNKLMLKFIFVACTSCTILYLYFLILSFSIIMFFGVCGVAANSDLALPTVSLMIAAILVIKTEFSILSRPALRVRVLLMTKHEELHDMTWGHVYMLLDKLHWLPSEIIKRRLPLYFGIVFTLGLMYFSLRMFSSGQQMFSSVVLQSVMLLAVGYIPGLLDNESYDEYTMLEAYKEITFKSIQADLKEKKFNKKSANNQEGSYEGSLLLIDG